MFSSISSLPGVKYSDPWRVDLAERLRVLGSRKRRVAYFYERADDSTFRYRTYNMVQVINAGDHDVSAAYFFLDDLHRLTEIADTADVLVICRTRYDNRINHLVTAFRNRHKRVLFDVDDFVFNTDFGHLILTTLDQDLANPKVWDDWFAYSSRIGMTLRLCEGAITTNDFLADRIREFSGLPVAVVPNFINREQLELSDRIFAAKETLKPGEDGTIHFGYFSGSPSHNRDFAMVIPALEALLEERKDVGLVVVGYIEPGPVLSRFGSRVKYYPFQDFVNLQQLVGSVEFNLMPLQYNVFTNCKSELKYTEAAIVGTLSIASPSYTYARAISEEETGYLAQSCSWETAMRSALGRLDQYREMAERAYKDVRDKCAWFNQGGAIMAALGLEGSCPIQQGAKDKSSSGPRPGG